MTRPLVLLTLAAAVFAASATAGPPPPPSPIAVTHTRPIAGHSFTGLTVLGGVGGRRIENATCIGTIGLRTLPEHAARFYSSAVRGVAAITCTWQIPAGTSGKTFHGEAEITVAGAPAGALEDAGAGWVIR
jgi:hypothetical protein